MTSNRDRAGAPRQPLCADSKSDRLNVTTTRFDWLMSFHNHLRALGVCATADECTVLAEIAYAQSGRLDPHLVAEVVVNRLPHAWRT